MVDKIVRTLNLSIADGCAVTEADVIYDAVRKDGLGERDLLYSGLEGKKLEVLLEQGTLYPNSGYIFAAAALDGEDELIETCTPLFCAGRKVAPMIAVYDKTKFVEKDPHMHHFIDPEHKLETLLAVYMLKY